MNYIEEIKDTLDYLETRLEQLNEFGSDEYHKINNCRIAVEEIEKLLKPSSSTKLSIPDVGQSCELGNMVRLGENGKIYHECKTCTYTEQC